MASPHGIKLAVHLVKSHFGDLVSKVCECLLRRGTLTIPEIIQHTELTHENVKRCLLVLIQHNCVQAFSIEHQGGGFGKVDKVLTHYTLLFDNVLHRMRFSKFLMIVSEEFGKECQAIVEHLLKHGRLTLEQVLESQSDKVEVQGALRVNFVRLVNAHFLEHCPAGRPSLVPPSKEEASTGKKRVAKFTRVDKPMTIEELAITAAIPEEAERFHVEAERLYDEEENNMDNLPRVTIGEKRKLDAFEMDEDLEDSKKEVIWRVNFEKLVDRLRHKVCIANVRSRLDEGSVIVLSAVLETNTSETNFSLNTIYEKVMMNERGRTMTLDHVRASLAELDCDKTESDEYSIDLENIIDQARNNEVETLVLKRYGRDAYKIFRLLSKSSHLLETDRISDTTFIDKMDTPKILYKLWKDGYLHMEKIVLPALRQSELVLWKVNEKTVWERVLDDTYHAALNLIQRIASEEEQGGELSRIPSDKRVGEVEERYKRWGKTMVFLESSLMKIDDAVMLFQNF